MEGGRRGSLKGDNRGRKYKSEEAVALEQANIISLEQLMHNIAHPERRHTDLIFPFHDIMTEVVGYVFVKSAP